MLGLRLKQWKFVFLQFQRLKTLISIKILQIWFLAEGLLPGLQMSAFSLCPHIVARENSTSSIIRTPVLLDQGLILMTLFNLTSLVHLSYYNKIPQVIYKKQIYLDIVLEAGKSKIKSLTESVSAEGLLPGSQTAVFSLCLHMVEWTYELSGDSFVGPLILFRRALPHGLITFQRSHLLIPSPQRLEFSHELGDTLNLLC